MTQKTLSKLSKVSPVVITTSVATVTPPQTQVEGSMGTKFTVFAIAFNVIGLAAVSFGGTAFSGNALVADLVLGSSLVCLTASLFRSSFDGLKQKLGRFK